MVVGRENAFKPLAPKAVWSRVNANPHCQRKLRVHAELFNTNKTPNNQFLTTTSLHNLQINSKSIFNDQS